MWPVTVVKCKLLDIAGSSRVCYGCGGAIHANNKPSITISLSSIVGMVKEYFKLFVAPEFEQLVFPEM